MSCFRFETRWRHKKRTKHTLFQHNVVFPIWNGMSTNSTYARNKQAQAPIHDNTDATQNLARHCRLFLTHTSPGGGSLLSSMFAYKFLSSQNYEVISVGSTFYVFTHDPSWTSDESFFSLRESWPYVIHPNITDRILNSSVMRHVLDIIYLNNVTYGRSGVRTIVLFVYQSVTLPNLRFYLKCAPHHPLVFSFSTKHLYHDFTCIRSYERLPTWSLTVFSFFPDISVVVCVQFCTIAYPSLQSE